MEVGTNLVALTLFQIVTLLASCLEEVCALLCVAWTDVSLELCGGDWRNEDFFIYYLRKMLFVFSIFRLQPQP